jgi:hypothetical protein
VPTTWHPPAFRPAGNSFPEHNQVWHDRVGRGPNHRLAPLASPAPPWVVPSRWFSREGQPLYIVEGAPVQETTNPAMEDSNLAGSAPLHWLGHADETTQVGLVHLRTSNFGLPGYRRLNSPPSRWQPKGYRRLNLRFIARKSFGLPPPRALRDPPALRYWRYMRSVYLHGGPPV